MIVCVGLLLDMILDNLVVPRLLSDSLQVHPAAVMVAALIGASWLGMVGILLAAPVLASFKLLGNYALLKLFDKNPWSQLPQPQRPEPSVPILYGVKAMINKIRKTKQNPK